MDSEFTIDNRIHIADGLLDPAHMDSDQSGTKNNSLNTQQGEKNNLLRLSPRKPRNMKNLSLDLSPNPQHHKFEEQQQQQNEDNNTNHKMLHEKPTVMRARTSSNALPFRHPSLSIHRSLSNNNNDDFQRPPSLQRRRTTLAITIPSNIQKRSSPETNAVPKFDSSMKSPVSISPSIPDTPNTDFQQTFDTTTNKEQQQQQQQLSHSIHNLNITDDFRPDSYRMGAYKNGPACVYEPNLYLYSEPTLDQIKEFDIVINVAKELRDYSDTVRNDPSIKTNYIFVPWTHTSQLCQDFTKLVPIIENGLAQDLKILIHCQCGVSRSASLVVAFLMKHSTLNLNDAYNELKLKAPLISPNMTLIFQLMEWNNILTGKPRNSNVSSPTSAVGSSNTLNAFVPNSGKDLVPSPTLSEVIN